MRNPALSVVIPLFNEGSRIDNIKLIYQFFKKTTFETEIIAVNDGSTDNTLKALKILQKKYGFSILSYKKNRGKGFALKKGFLKALGKFILFTDIDLSVPLIEFEKFTAQLNLGDILIATRKDKKAKVLKRQSSIRESMGKGYTYLSQMVLGLKISDFTCGFKLFTGKAGKDIFSKLTVDRWAFDSEVLFIAAKRGYKIKEIPITWINDPKTKVKFPQDILNSLKDLLKIRLNQISGKYN